MLAFLSGVGIAVTSADNGFCYPMSERAEDVVRALESEAKASGVSFMLGSEVRDVSYDGAFRISCGGEDILSHRLIISSGGKAGPQYGTTGDSYRFARGLGHTVNKVFPVLTGLRTPDSDISLKGVRVRASCALLRDGAPAAEERGEVQFGDGYVSGICVMDLSRELRYSEGKPEKYELKIDLLPDMDEDSVRAALSQRENIKWMGDGDILNSIVPSKLAAYIMRRCGITGGRAAGAAAHCLKNLTLRISGAQGWKTAQCTAGGVATDEVFRDTMESKIIPGLYFTGEALDYDGPCGGFNLNNAWLTGIKAGRAAAE